MKNGFQKTKLGNLGFEKNEWGTGMFTIPTSCGLTGVKKRNLRVDLEEPRSRGVSNVQQPLESSKVNASGIRKLTSGHQIPVFPLFLFTELKIAPKNNVIPRLFQQSSKIGQQIHKNIP